MATNREKLDVSADVPFSVKAPDGRVIAQYAANTVVGCVANNGLINCNGKPVPDGSKFAVQGDEEKGSLVYASRKYRGTFTLLASGEGKKLLTLVNVLAVDKYLYSVVGTEISPKWPQECLKAQAVAARSYAVSSLDGKRKYPLFDVLPDTSDQGYSGRGTEDVNTRRAVDSTRGIVAMYSGKTAKTLFMSGAGGQTAAAVEVWGTDYPYLQSVKDYDNDSPYYCWTQSVKLEEFSVVLYKAGYRCGKISEILLSPLPAAGSDGGNCGDRTPSGRVALVAIVGEKETIEITGLDMRKLFGLKSTLFEIKIDKDTVIFCGRGWGHGIGLSQYGARHMAEPRDKGGLQMNYQQILKYYFSGIELRKIY